MAAMLPRGICQTITCGKSVWPSYYNAFCLLPLQHNGGLFKKTVLYVLMPMTLLL